MSDKKELKQLPYGVSDFKKFRDKNYYFVDKTRYIRDIEKKGDYLFLIRPRRFGKSLFLAIMEAYYDIAYKDRFDFFFQGADIYRNPTAEKNSYIVLSLDFSNVADNIKQVEESFLNYIKGATFNFILKYREILNIDIEKAEAALDSKNNASDVMVTFLDYCKRQNQKLYIIIDEYDNFANTILSSSGEPGYKAITQGEGFFHSFFNVLKGGTSRTDAPISRLFMTGVSPVTLDDVTSGFNIATNISLDADLNEIMGFDKNDVETMIEYYRQTGKILHSTPDLTDIMSHWYNHYKFSLRSPNELFNTDQVLYFLREYMKESRIPGNLIDRNARIDYNKLRHLIIIDKQGTQKTNGNFSVLQHIIETGSIHSSIETGFSIEELTNPGNFISLLYYFGLLTIRGIDEEDTPILSIPNQMIKRLYFDYIDGTYRDTGILNLDANTYKSLVRGMAYKGNWEALVKFVADCMESSLGLRDLMTGEKAHQVFWNIYLGMTTLYNVYSEKEMKQGFCDLALVPILAKNPTIKYSYLIEIKYIKPSDLEKENHDDKLQVLGAEAESQLNRYGSDKKFLESIGNTTLKKLVLIFSGNRLVHYYEI